MKYITNYEIKFINNKPIIIINYSDNSFDMKELSNDIYNQVINELNNNIKLFDREYITKNLKGNNLLKAGLVCLGLSSSSPFIFVMSNYNTSLFASINILGFLYYFYSVHKSDLKYADYLKYDLYLKHIDILNNLDEESIKNISLNSLVVLSKRLKLIKKVNLYNKDIYLPIIDASIVNKLNLKDIEKLIDNSRKKKLVKKYN